MQAAIYCRISEDREGGGLGVERQRQECETMAARRGWNVTEVYTDNDISAYSGKPRPAYRRLLHDIEAGRVRAVITWHLDRLHRSPRELEGFIDLVERNGVALASVAGEHDLATPDGRLHARIMGAVARMESEHKSRRIRLKKLELARAGKPLGGGYRPYGYERDGITINRKEADVLHETASRLLCGDSLRSVVLDLNARGLHTSTGRPWVARSLKRVLLTPRNIGVIEHREAGPLPAGWEPIFTEELRTRLMALLGDPSRRQPPGRPRRYLLSGLLRCGHCGKALYSVNARNERGRAYGCAPPPAGCNHTLIVAGWAEDFVIRCAHEYLDKPRLFKGRRASADHDRDLDAINADRAQLDELATAYAQRTITMSEWVTAREAIQKRIDETTQRLAQQESQHALHRLLTEGAKLIEQWQLLPLERQRTILAQLIDHIVIRPVGRGKYGDPTRIWIVWRHF
jgi:site-specific DNA recombinase